jgi:hypothetical protein
MLSKIFSSYLCGAALKINSCLPELCEAFASAEVGVGSSAFFTRWSGEELLDQRAEAMRAELRTSDP